MDFSKFEHFHAFDQINYAQTYYLRNAPTWEQQTYYYWIYTDFQKKILNLISRFREESEIRKEPSLQIRWSFFLFNNYKRTELLSIFIFIQALQNQQANELYWP